MEFLKRLFFFLLRCIFIALGVISFNIFGWGGLIVYILIVLGLLSLFFR